MRIMLIPWKLGLGWGVGWLVPLGVAYLAYRLAQVCWNHTTYDAPKATLWAHGFVYLMILAVVLFVVAGPLAWLLGALAWALPPLRTVVYWRR